MNTSKLLLSAATTLTIFSFISGFDSENVLQPPPIPGSKNVLSKAQTIQLDGTVGPESVAFDPNGEGPYTGVADGRVLKWQQDAKVWVKFAVTSKNCSRSRPAATQVCGRPLGLRFDHKTGDLYIADANFGLQVVGPKGGLTTPVVQQFKGKPLVFTNDLDIDEHDGVIYFTESSSKYHVGNLFPMYVTGDRTGKLLKYEKSTKQVTLMLGGLAFANGVSLNKNRSFVLVAELSACKILRYWLKGPYKGTHDTFAELPGYPDNIRTNSRGEFWVALHAKRSLFAKMIPSNLQLGKELLKLPFNSQQRDSVLVGGQQHATAIKLSEEGRVLEVLEDVEGKTLRTISQVEEKFGKLWIGSVATPVLGVYELS